MNFVYGEIAHFGSLKQIAPLAFYAFFLAGIEIHIARTDNDEFCRMINEARRQKITRYGGYAETKFGSVRTNARRAVSENFVRHFIRARRASATKNYLITGKFPVGYIAEKIVRLCRIPRDGRTFYVERFERIEEIYGGGYVLQRHSPEPVEPFDKPVAVGKLQNGEIHRSASPRKGENPLRVFLDKRGKRIGKHFTFVVNDNRFRRHIR